MLGKCFTNNLHLKFPDLMCSYIEPISVHSYKIEFLLPIYLKLGLDERHCWCLTNNCDCEGKSNTKLSAIYVANRNMSRPYKEHSN